MFGRNKVAIFLAEFIGTFALTTTVFAMLGRNIFYPLGGAMVAGLTLGVMTLVVGATSGSHINPVVTLGLWTARKIKTLQALVYMVAQVAGAYASWLLCQYLLNQKLINKGGPTVMNWRIFTAEAVGTFIFTFGLASAIYQGYKGLKFAATAGTSLFVGSLVASFGSLGLLNPAVAGGLRTIGVAYVAGPVIGAIVGINLYSMLFAPSRVAVAKATSVSRPVAKKRRK